MSKSIESKMMNELLQLVSFKIGEEEYGVDILTVQEIIKYQQITKIPNSPDFVEGVISLRGRVIPVIDLRAFMGMAGTINKANSNIVIVEIEERTVGFIVDAVSEVLRVPKNITEAPPELMAHKRSEFVVALAKLSDKLIILIDLGRIFEAAQKREIFDLVDKKQ